MITKISLTEGISNIRRNAIYGGSVSGFFSMLKQFTPTPLRGYIYLLEEEIKDEYSVKLPLKLKINAIKYGFTTKEYYIYGLQNGVNPDLYLSKSKLLVYSQKINNNPDVLTNKKKFYDYMSRKSLNKYLPALLGIIINGKFHGIKTLEDYLHERKKIVIKPYHGREGRGIIFVEKNEEKIFINGKEKKVKGLGSMINKNLEYIVTEYCKQSNFLRKINPHSANTIRIITMTPEREKTFFPMAILRIGTKKSCFLDNISQGGLSAEINLETGKLSSAAEFLPSGKVKWHDIHPDTNSQIKDVVIPEWCKFKKNFMAIITKLYELKYVGWDILLTENGGEFVIIEGNNCPMITSLQVHKSLLKNPRVKNFYKDNGVPV